MITENVLIVCVVQSVLLNSKAQSVFNSIMKSYSSIIFSDSRECSLNLLSCRQGCMSKFFNIRVNAISVCQYLQLKIFINSASSSLALKSCQEIIIINLQRILSIASSLSTMYFCLSKPGLRPSPEAAILLWCRTTVMWSNCHLDVTFASES